MFRCASAILPLLLASVVTGCDANREGMGGGGGNPGGQGGTGGTHGTSPEFSPCTPLIANTCAPGLTCASVGVNGRCAHSCDPASTSGGGCPQNRVCLPQYTDPSLGYCVEERGYYDTCEGQSSLSGCSPDSYCLSQIPSMPDRCVPVCAIGDLTVTESVDACPALPPGFAALGDTATQCTPITVGAAEGSLCSLEVPVGAPCDQATLRCNLDGSRPDTDPEREPSAQGELDIGALHCLPAVGGGAQCLRACRLPGAGGGGAGGTFGTEPCGCPPDDPLCDDPSDPGLDWACVTWPPLSAPEVGACQPLEDCTADATVCADNTASGLTACVDSPYSNVPGKICGLP